MSVVVVSNDRPEHLRLCLTALAQQDHPMMEIVVVACAAGAAAIRDDWDDRVKLVVFDTPNISAARNLGLAQAAGAVVAFVDDDALAEPTWARRLSAPFADPSVAQAGGFVRGRNGISFQWRALELDAQGRDHPLDVPQGCTTLHPGSAQRTPKTQGTCCAFRRTALLSVGGFDPGFAFYLDEGDVNLRLSRAGHMTAIVPDAQVIHGFAPSARRRADRVPRDLHAIGASTARFVRRHSPEALGTALAVLRSDQRARLGRHRGARRLPAAEARRLMETLESGIDAGCSAALTDLHPLPDAPPPFRALQGTGPRRGRMILSLPGRRAAPEAEAQAARARGEVVTLLRLDAGFRAHWHSLRPDGIWQQRGGMWGRSLRDTARVQWMLPATRMRVESAWIGRCRPVE